MKKLLLKSNLIKFLMVLFWVACLLLFLFLPSNINFFSRPKDDTLNIFCWSDMIDAEALKEFEKLYNVKVNLSYYEQNFELFSKLELTQGKGYDLLMVTDFTINFLKEAQLLKPLDLSALNFFHELEPTILNRTYDPHNQYSLPYVWDIYVVGYDRTCFMHNKPHASLDLLFDPAHIPQHIAMLDEANEAFAFAQEYKFSEAFDYENPDQWRVIKQLFLRQKKFVEAYTDLRAGDLLLSGSVCAALSQAAHIYKAKKQSNDIEIFIPQPRTFIVFDGFVIPRATEKDALVYAFLNFIYQKKVLENIINKYFYLPSRKDLMQEMDLSYVGGIDTLLENVTRAKSFIPSSYYEKINRLWMEIKAY